MKIAPLALTLLAVALPLQAQAEDDLAKRLIGKWKIDAQRTIDQDPNNKDLPAEFRKELAKSLSKLYASQSYSFSETEMSSGFEGLIVRQSYTIKSRTKDTLILEVTEADEKSVEEVKVTFLKDAIILRLAKMKNKQVLVLVRTSSKEEPVTGPAKHVAGSWQVDVLATMKMDPKMKEVPESFLKELVKDLGKVYENMSYKFTAKHFVSYLGKLEIAQKYTVKSFEKKVLVLVLPAKGEKDKAEQLSIKLRADGKIELTLPAPREAKTVQKGQVLVLKRKKKKGNSAKPDERPKTGEKKE